LDHGRSAVLMQLLREGFSYRDMPPHPVKQGFSFIAQDVQATQMRGGFARGFKDCLAAMIN